MNKTRKRAIQKHRAKAIKFELRRKNEGDQNTNRAKPAAQAAATPRASRSARRQEAAEENAE